MSNFDHSLDTIFLELGSFGKYQCRTVGYVGIAVLIYSAVHIAFVFTAKDLVYRCAVPECNSLIPEYNPAWLHNAVPFEHDKPFKCERFVYINKSNGSEACNEEDFDKNNIVKCEDFVYKTSEETILNDFSLHCDDNTWKLALIGTINSFGQFLGLPISGFISDKYGRRPTMIYGMVLCSIAGLARSFTTSYISFALLEFADAVFCAGVYSCAFILGVELVGPEKRVLVSTIVCCSYALGEVFAGGVAWLTQSWRPYTQILYSLPLVLLAYFWLVPESVRWLLSQNRYEEAKAILRKVAATNGETITEDQLQFASEDKMADATETYPIAQLFKSRILLMRFINCSFCWITCTFLFYGLTINSVTLSGNGYLDFILTSLIEIPGYFCAYLVVDRIGRRLTESGSFFISGFACASFIFIPKELYWLQLIMYLLGKFGATAAFNICYIITSELFPTPLRHSLLAAASMFGRIGAMIAPQMPLLETVWRPLPLVLFTCMGTLSGLLTLLFPETVNLKLPDTIEEAEQIGKLSHETKLDTSYAFTT